MGAHVAAERPAAGLLHLSVSTRASMTRISVEGELDMATAPVLEKLLDRQRGPVLLDLRSLDFIDSSGLRLLLSAEERSRRDGSGLRLASGRITRRLFELTGLTEHFALIAPDFPLDD